MNIVYRVFFSFIVSGRLLRDEIVCPIFSIILIKMFQVHNNIRLLISNQLNKYSNDLIRMITFVNLILLK